MPPTGNMSVCFFFFFFWYKIFYFGFPCIKNFQLYPKIRVRVCKTLSLHIVGEIRATFPTILIFSR